MDSTIPPYKGARFYKCALQVNSNHGKTWQGEKPQDKDIYNREILEQCQTNGIKVVGIADHGDIEHSKELRNYLTDHGIIVFPGFEITSSEGIHMVCLYDSDTSDSKLDQFLGQLMGKRVASPNNNHAHQSSHSCGDMATKIIDQEGFWYAAHITSDGGLLKLSLGNGKHCALWKEDDLVIAGQIPGAIKDLDYKYKMIISNQDPNYKRERRIAIINAKDVYKPEQLSHPSASCRIKMTKATFPAFKDAFKDPQSRISLNYDSDVQGTPASVIESIRWRGATGLFEDRELAFSHHLNAIIGGRGTGKSTLIESIRFVLDLPPRGDRKDIEDIQLKNLEQVELKLRCRSQYGSRYTIRRRRGENPIVINESGEISQMTPRELLPQIELLGQNEILAIEESKELQLQLMERFLPDGQKLHNRIDEAKRKLSDNRRKMIVAQEEFDATEQLVNRKDKLEERRRQYQKLGIEEKLKNIKLLEKEKGTIEHRVDEQLNLLDNWLEQYETIFDLYFLQDRNIQNLPNKKIIASIGNDLEQLKTLLDALVQQASQKMEATKSAYQSKRGEWQERANAMREHINHSIAQLPDQKGKSGQEMGTNYAEIIAELTSIERHQKEHILQKKLINGLESERRLLLEEYRDTAFERYDVMAKRIKELNKKEFQGKIKITIWRCKNMAELKKFLCSLSGVGQGKIKWLDELDADDEARGSIDLVEWSQWIKNKSKDKFIRQYKQYGLTDSMADRLTRISLEQRFQLEEIELEDVIKIALNVAHGSDAQEKYVFMENLSVGQKCTAILNLLLANLSDPLIIDQPEDHLDNAFIAERIVSELRKIKTKRQFLFATHNANIPVFGDAELIVVLESQQSKATFKNIGSIDDSGIRDQAAQILEGGKAAFDMRKEKYGF